MESECHKSGDGPEKRKNIESNEEEHSSKKICIETAMITKPLKDQPKVLKEPSKNRKNEPSSSSKLKAITSKESKTITGVENPVSVNKIEHPLGSVSLPTPLNPEGVSSINVISTYISSHNVDSQDKISEITESEISSLLERDSESLIDKTQEQSLGLSVLTMNVENSLDNIEAQIISGNDKILDTDDSVSNIMENILSIVENKSSNISSVCDTSGINKELPNIEAVVSKDIPNIEAIVSKDLLKIEEIISKDLPDMETILSKDLPNVEANVTKDLSNIEAIISKDIPNIEAIISKDIPNIEAIVSKDLPNLEAIVSKDLPNIEAIVSKDLPNIEAIINKDFSDVEAIISKDLPDVEAIISKDLPDVEAIISKDLPDVEAIVNKNLSDMEAIISKDLLNIDAQIVSSSDNYTSSKNNKVNEESIEELPSVLKSYSTTSCKNASPVGNEINEVPEISKSQSKDLPIIATGKENLAFKSTMQLLTSTEEKENVNKPDSFLIPDSVDSSSKSSTVPVNIEINEPKKPINENIKDAKANLMEVDAEKISISVSSSKKNLTFEGTLKKISLESSESGEKMKNFDQIVSPSDIKNKTPLPNTDSSFEPICDSVASSLITETEVEVEVSGMEIDSVNHTPIEGSIVDTPDSGETSPSMSTPADSCQVSAAPSPLLKEDTNIASESLLYDESSMDTKDLLEDVGEEKEEETIKPTKVSRKRGRKATPKYKKKKGKMQPVVIDEETRMSASGTGISDIGMDEDSQSSTGTISKKEPRRYRGEIIVPESTEVFTAEKVTEYMWPLEGIGEHYFIQEQISQYLGIMSFKRKYPDLRRRPIESQEKEYLKELGLVTEIACDLGLTAVRSEDALDIMFNDFPTKYEELQRVLRESKEKQFKEKSKVDYQVVNLDKSKMQEYSRKAALNAFKWNTNFNRERIEERRYCFDLQTFTLHLPVDRGVKLPPQATKMGSHPVAVLPGQYTDYCKKYSSDELRAMPLQTVLLGPFTADELATDLQDDSDEESAAASLGTCPEIKEEQPDIPPVIDPLSAEKQPRCKVCNGGRARNKDGKPEPLIICGTCRTASHPTCIDLTLVMIDKIESYSWQCMDCKTCAQCNDPDDEEKMIFCDMCDRGYHIYCVGLRRVPNGRWHCKECAACYTCGAKTPSGNEHIKNAEWQHEFKKDKNNKQLKYVCTLCVPCDKYWKRRQFCLVCFKVYRSIPEDGMVRCSGCPKYVHKEVCSIMHENERFCNSCFKGRNKTALNHSRIIAAAKKKMATGPLWK